MSTQMGNADRQIGAGVAAAPCDALFADLCELTMLQTYFAQGMEDQAVFSLFVRRLPEHRKYLLACGLDTVLDYLEHLRFTSDDTPASMSSCHTARESTRRRVMLAERRLAPPNAIHKRHRTIVGARFPARIGA